MHDNNSIRDTNIALPKALIKFGKMEHMVRYIEIGELRFAPAYEFSHMKEGENKIADKNEGSLFYPISKLYAAPLLFTDEEGNDIYGKPFKIADTAIQCLIMPSMQRIPFHCLYCYQNPPINAVVRLDNYDEIVRDFPDYDTAVVIYKPLDFLKKLENEFEIYANYVMYAERTPFEDEIKNGIHCLYYKRERHREQNEFRISLPQLQIEKPKIYQIGSLLDIAYCLPLRCLKHGVIIADNDNDFQALKRSCTDAGLGIGDRSRFFDIRET